MYYFSKETEDFINRHRHDDVRILALQTKKYPLIDVGNAVIQIAGRQIAEKKLPTWADIDNIIYPKHLSMEQCSSEITARYKASLVNGKTFTDLTAGFGVDCYFLSRKFEKAHYVERQEELCKIAEHNFKLLEAENILVHNNDCIDFLNDMEPVDCIFIDPARRNSNGGKTVAITECEPDICKMEHTLVNKGKTVMIKLSPMLDIHTAIHELKFINSIHIVSVNNECKELIIILKKADKSNHIADNEIIIHCEQIVNNSQAKHLSFTYNEEKETSYEQAVNIGKYIYEPGAALLKAGPFKLISKRYNVKKLHINSHLYTSDSIVDFPGRRFEVTEISSFGKKELKAFTKGLEKANITIRNFPSTVAELRKKLKLKDGGDIYIFATTIRNDEKVLIKCKSIN